MGNVCIIMNENTDKYSLQKIDKLGVSVVMIRIKASMVLAFSYNEFYTFIKRFSTLKKSNKSSLLIKWRRSSTRVIYSNNNV